MNDRLRLVAVYKSSKKPGAYLFISKRDDFSDVPKALLETFGTPQFVMLIPIEKRLQLAAVSPDRLKASLNEKGYYLQLPPPQESLLKQHLAQQKKV